MRIYTHTYEKASAPHTPVPPGTAPPPNHRRLGSPPRFSPQKSFPARLSPHHQTPPEDRHQIRAPRIGFPGPRHDPQPSQASPPVGSPFRAQLAPAPITP